MHQEAITSKQKKLLGLLPNPPQFYLAGGTALALQIGHRISADFDFFSKGKLPLNLLAQLEKKIGRQQMRVIVREPHQLTLSIQGVETTYLHYPFPPLFPLVQWEARKLLSVREIAAAKAYALGRRATLKDYVDLYFIFKEKHSSLREVLELAERKYKELFDARLFLEQLVYLQDVLATPIRFLKEKAEKGQIESFFAAEIKKLPL